MANKTLYLFTNRFPYGKGEFFLENEMPYLHLSFDKVYIIPELINPFNANDKRNIYDSIVIDPCASEISFIYALHGILFITKNIKSFVKLFWKYRCYANFNKLENQILAYLYAGIFLSNKRIKKILSGITESDIMYFYWGTGNAHILPFIKHIKAKKIVRFHGYDLYEERSGGFIPNREELLSSLDLAVFISKNGESYLHDKYPQIIFKSIVSYLGTNDNGLSQRSMDNVLRIVSCSFVIPIKRVHLIYEALMLIKDEKIEWTHIGSGPLFDELRQLTNKKNENLKINLVGVKTNREVLNYYNEHAVDVFINVSSSEGLPVSIMEAISFNIPVIASNVGGTSEIVTEETGLLLQSNPSPEEIAAAIKKVEYLEINPRNFWKENFNAEKNYTKFIKCVKEE
jgi:glycosyltransferase involved in cell wall biosynthesis